MGFLSWLFFCLSPFALFCSEDGNGLILCPVFIILGLVFKFAESNSSGKSTATVKVEPQKFWEWHYVDRMRNTLNQKDSINDGLMALRDKEARRWATTICGYHNAWVPPKDKQEQIARSYGVITEKIAKENTIKRDRIQIGKYFLMSVLKFKYSNAACYTKREIEKDMKKITISEHLGADDWCVKQKYGKTVREMCKTLTDEEKREAVEWINEYESKLVQAVKDYESHKTSSVRPVEMDF